jgi:pyrroloquinoline quinone (PQQ) biosynthesis protein C
MSFFDRLQNDTAEARTALLSTPLIADCMRGIVSRDSYTAFLCQAYHHVRHTVPLLMACGARLPMRLGWLGKHVVEYIDEEFGHERWIANDIAAVGGDVDRLLDAGPNPSTELMVAYAYDTIARGNPVAFFGMVYVLEGTSVSIATNAAGIIQRELGLSSKAFTYLRSHGSLDIEHIENFRQIMDRLDDTDDQHDIIHGANMFFRLYRGVFEELPRAGIRSGHPPLPESRPAHQSKRAVA